MPQSVRRDYVDVNGMNIYYTMAGQGPPVVLLHGLGASHLTWQENFEALAENFTVYAMDIPGHGDSVKEGVTYTIEAGIAFTLGFLMRWAYHQRHWWATQWAGLSPSKSPWISPKESPI